MVYYFTSASHAYLLYCGPVSIGPATDGPAYNYFSNSLIELYALWRACWLEIWALVNALCIFSSTFILSTSAMYRRCAASLYEIPKRSWSAITSAWADKRSLSLLPFRKSQSRNRDKYNLTYRDSRGHDFTFGNDTEWVTVELMDLINKPAIRANNSAVLDLKLNIILTQPACP